MSDPRNAVAGLVYQAFANAPRDKVLYHRVTHSGAGDNSVYLEVNHDDIVGRFLITVDYVPGHDPAHHAPRG